MAGGLGIQVSAHPIASFCPLGIISSSDSLSFLRYSSNRRSKKIVRVQANLKNAGESPASSSSSEAKNPLAVVLDVPKNVWKQTLRPLSDFGFGKKSIWEGGVGLFIVTGAVLFALSVAWLKGFQLRSRMKKYQAVFEFTQACGISTGTAVRIRGVTVGNVVHINPSLKSIEAVVEIEDEKTIIPRNSLIEVNQSGLLMEPTITSIFFLPPFFSLISFLLSFAWHSSFLFGGGCKMCPLRIILIFLSATLAGIFLIKNIKSSQPDLHNLDKSHEESSPSEEPPRSSKISSAISSGFWTCVDMASGRYLWRNLVSSNPSAASAKQS